MRVETERQLRAVETVERPWQELALSDSHEVLGGSEQIDELVDYIIATWQPEKREFWRGEYEDNARTAILEAITAKGHLSRIEYAGDLDDTHNKILQRLVNGLHVPCLHPHERERRRAEIREEVVIWLVGQRIMNGELPLDTAVLTDSTFPDAMTTQEAADVGYRPDNHKGMLRETRPYALLPNGEIGRVVEQLSYSNSSSLRSLELRGLVGDDVVSIGRPLVSHDLRGGVVDVMRAMDEHGQMYGELPDDMTIDYCDVRAISADREARIEHFIQELADYERRVDASDGRLTQQDYYNKLREIVRRICVIDPCYTADALGDDAVSGYERAHEQFTQGDFAGAADTIQSTASLEKAVLACGGSSSTEVALTAAQQAQLANMSEAEKAAFIKKLKTDHDQLVWEPGYCRIKLCPSEGKRVEVAQCKVCRGCQNIFDNGRDPAQIYAEKAKNQKSKQGAEQRQKQKRQLAGKTIDVTKISYNIWGVEKVIYRRKSEREDVEVGGHAAKQLVRMMQEEGKSQYGLAA